ncbi:MAG: ruvX [Bacteroidetes bacterium]|jgi:putative holliday junction resolvase|nr:ruvX [Bacteroidota bacterium]
MGRLLSIDYGQKRVGIAVSDSLQIIANGLTTVPTVDLFKFLKEYFAKEPVEKVIVGKPMQTNGQPSENLQRATVFVQKFQATYPDIPVEWYDERFTSVLAHQAMIDGGLGKKARQNKALVDEISASIILRDYMESRRR